MTIAINHDKVATLPDEPGAEVNKAEWNAAHVLTQATAKLLGRATALDGATEEITPGARLSFAGTTLNVDADPAGTATAAVTAHEAAADPHIGYQKESEKGAANGYASLGADALVPQDQLGTGVQDGTKFLRDDGAWVAPTASVADPNSQSYSPDSFTVATEKYVILSRRLKLTTTQRVTGQGTSCVRVT